MFNFEDIYVNCLNAGSAVERIVYEIRRQNYDRGIREYKLFLKYYQAVAVTALKNIEQFQAFGIGIDPAVISSVLSGLMQAQEHKDYILLADLMELQAAPFLSALKEAIEGVENFRYGKNYFQEAMEKIQKKNPELYKQLESNSKKLRCVKTNTYVNESLEISELGSMREPAVFESLEGAQYSIESTLMGVPTLKVIKENANLYLHSNKSPVWEAKQFADEYYESCEETYHILGLGLGYHVSAFWEKTRGLSKLTVYENDIYVIILAIMYRQETGSLLENVEFVYDPKLSFLGKGSQLPGSKVVIHHPSLQLIQKSPMKENLEEYFIQESSYRNQKELLDFNFMYNLSFYKKNPEQVMDADMLEQAFFGKRVYIIGAGPSLDQNVLQLKNRNPQSIILTTGTAFYKLMRLGIIPDYIIESDANERTVFHLRNCENSEIPMLLLATANCHFMEKYKGKKYLVFQKDYEKSEAYRQAHEGNLYQTGGSVVTVALDLMIRFKAESIVFLGLDLAFTNDRAHATMTSGEIATDKEELFLVPGYYKDQVYSDVKFNIYRKWIERRLLEEDVKGICILNATEGGSYIAGMENKPLVEVL